MKPVIVQLISTEKYQRLLHGDPQTKGMKSGHVILQPAESVGEHTTAMREEAIIVLQGKGEVTADNNPPMAIQEGAVVYIPPETRHNVKNTSNQLLEYIYVVSPILP